LSAGAIGRHAETLAAHYGKDCPAALVYHASWPDEQIVRGTLADIAEKTTAAGISKTALLIVRQHPRDARSRLYAPDFTHGYRAEKG
jgi:precorrin-4/cobalt-precorrin-4 C11-methyltransferase